MIIQQSACILNKIVVNSCKNNQVLKKIQLVNVHLVYLDTAIILCSVHLQFLPYLPTYKNYRLYNSIRNVFNESLVHYNTILT